MKKIFTLLSILGICLSASSQDNEKETAGLLISEHRKEIGLTEKDLENVIIKDAYYNRFAGTHMVYLLQSYLGLPVRNQIQVLAFKDGKPVSNNGGRIRKIEALAGNSAVPAYAAENAVVTALHSKNIFDYQQLDGKITGTKIDFGTLGVSSETVTAELMWLPLNEGKEIRLVWEIRLVPVTGSDFFLIRVDAMEDKVIDENNLTIFCQFGSGDNCSETGGAGHIHSADGDQQQAGEQKNAPGPDGVNLVTNASYKVIAYPAESPNHPGGAPSVVNNPWTLSPGNATSLGWHSDGVTDYNIGRGNNVYAQEDRDNSNTTSGGSCLSSSSPDPLNFSSTPDFTQAPTVAANQQFALTNLFYWNNVIHDISYRHGFDEVSGNFQNTNLGRGGQGGDYVVADCQDAGGTNNANFATPDDGTKPRMQMYLWSGTPQKDGSLDNGVVSHEFAHGISNRLTGGPSSSSCLTNAEQMGEGWSDYFGIMVTQNWAASDMNTGYNSPRSVGTYVSGQPITGRGIRTQKYCTNMSVNSKVYLQNLPNAQHDRGEIWCVTLWDMTWNIINQTGHINPTLFDTTSNGGNSIALRLVLEGMRLQQCNPGFISGRNAILKADSILYGGQFGCAIREAFRRRGMGVLASEGSTNLVTDQVPDYTGGVFLELSQGGVTQVAEGQEITYVHTVSSSCATITNYIIRDTLPAEVTYVSGGTYNATSRVVSFTVTQPIGATQTYEFKVKVNSGTYFTPTYPLKDSLASSSLPSGWITAAIPTSGVWTVSNLASHSQPYSFYVQDLAVAGDQKLVSPAFSLPAGTYPRLHFWHQFNTEEAWDGGVVEISTNGGSVWNDLGSLMKKNGYNGPLGDAPTCVLANRQAFSGTINDFQRTSIDLSNFAGTNPKIRFWFASDDNTSAPTTPAGWFVDDILLEVAPIVKMKATLYTETNVRIAVSDTVTYIVNTPVCVNASIISQPGSNSVCSGSNALFAISDQGTNNSYQWQISTDGGVTFNNITGATNDSLLLSSVTSAMDFYLYRVIITNQCPSSVTSTAALLRVFAPAAITTQPVNSTVCLGQTTGFSVSATGGINGYQWQVSTDGGSSFSDVVNETGTSISVSAGALSQNGNIYRVQISSCNNLNSSGASIFVLSPAQIDNQPASATVCTGNSHIFSVAASGNNIAYQWQVSTDGGVTWNVISGANTSSYSVTGVTSALDNNRYRVVISGTCGPAVTSAAAVLSVGAALNISSQPADLVACAGGNSTISISATGVVGYQWQVSTDNGVTWNNIAGATGSNLSLSPVLSSMQRNKYRVVLANCNADVISSVATLTVKDPVTIISQPADKSLCLGGSETLSVSASGSELMYQWQVSTDGGANWTNISGATNTTLPLNSVTLSQNGYEYRVVITPASPCIVFNTNAAILFVKPPPEVQANASPGTEICAGSPVTLSGSGAQTYSWNNGVVNGTAFMPSTSGTYIVTGTDVYGCVDTDDISITVNPLPSISISASPSNRGLLPGDSVVLTATSNPPASAYTWYRNNIIVPGVTGNTITVIFSTIGSYKASVTDAQTGCPNSSNVINVRDSVKTDVFIYPNPNNGAFTVRLPSRIPAGNYRVYVWDSKGALVFENLSLFENQEADFNLKNLAAGVYFIQILSPSGREIRTGKVVIASH